MQLFQFLNVQVLCNRSQVLCSRRQVSSAAILYKLTNMKNRNNTKTQLTR